MIAPTPADVAQAEQCVAGMKLIDLTCGEYWLDLGAREAVQHIAQALAAARAEGAAELDGAITRGHMVFEAKNHWADRARAAEARVAALEAAIAAQHETHMTPLLGGGVIAPGAKGPTYMRRAPTLSECRHPLCAALAREGFRVDE